MKDGRHGELNDIWPRIGAEIEKARGRKALGRRLPRLVAVSGAAALTVGLAIHAVMRPTRRDEPQKSRPQVPWDLTLISPARNVSAEYPLLCGDSVLALRGNGENRRVVCIHKHAGTIQWESAVRFAACRFACDDRRLYLMYRAATPLWQCIALDRRSGKELWRRSAEKAGGALPSMLTVTRGNVLWSRGNRLILCAGQSGRTVWTRTTSPNEMLTALRARGETVFAASLRSVYAFRTATGERLWTRLITQQQTGGLGRGLLEINKGRVFAAGRNPNGAWCISCLNAETGAVVWTAPSDMPFRLQATDKLVLVRSGALTALDARDGAPLWRAPVGGCGSISAREGRLYMVDMADRRGLIALDARSGQMKWRRGGGGSCNGVVADGGMAFISGNDGTLHALALN